MRRSLLVLPLLALLCVISAAQTAPPSPHGFSPQGPAPAPAVGAYLPAPAMPPAPPVPPTLPGQPYAVAFQVAQPPVATLDSLLDALETVQAQQATLTARENALKKAISEMATRHCDRMKKLGVSARTPPVAASNVDPLVSDTPPASVAPPKADH